LKLWRGSESLRALVRVNGLTIKKYSYLAGPYRRLFSKELSLSWNLVMGPAEASIVGLAVRL
jgi:hypothetical protein